MTLNLEPLLRVNEGEFLKRTVGAFKMEDKIQLLVGKSGNKDIFIDAQELVTGRTCVIGQSGSGKSYLIAVLCEKLLEKNIAFCIVDTEGEFFSLKQKFEILWAGGKDADIDIENVDLGDLIRKSVQENIPLILDLSDVMEERRVVADFAGKLYEIGTELRQPYLLIVEEADKFSPQSKDSIKEIEEISKRGRKRGIGLMIATQRPSLVNKNVLSQCGNRFIGKLATENDLKAVDLFFSDRKELESLPKLTQGEFFVSGGIVKEKAKIKSAERTTQHKGLTPKLVQKATGKMAELKINLASNVKQEEPKENVGEEKSFGKGRFEGIKLSITKEKIEKIIEDKRKKKFGLFGEKEKLASIDLFYQPFIWVQISLKEGLIRKSFKNYSFIVDAATGYFADLENGLSYYTGIAQLVGLDENHVRVLLAVSKDEKITVADLELKTKLSDQTIRKILDDLQGRRLITYLLDGRSKLYSPLSNLKIPDFKQSADFPEIEPISAKTQKPAITEDSVRHIIKGINSESDILKSHVFYYPIWQINFDKRKLRIDGVTGKEI